ncbi:MAG: 50S ribosomal protein L18 [Candidatus Hepatoplasma vulgare]|nr:MAG: 50S ribosomal protein L18 [Candidatus Hepatoplasma sp.]
MKVKNRKDARQLKRYRIRKKISGTVERPRISVFKSNKYFYVQIIDDVNGKTLASSSSKTLKLKDLNIETATKVGKDLVRKMKELKIENVVFDRSGYIYHGKIKAFCETLREEGIKF